MRRQFQRALRQWKKEFLTFWKRFNAFQRIVIGILIAMALVYSARLGILDPLSVELDEKRKTLKDKGIPSRVPDPETDDQIQQDILRAENLAESLAEEKIQRRKAESKTEYRLDVTPADVQAALISLAARSGLRVHENRPIEADKEGLIRQAAFFCELRGSFRAVFDFLSAFESAPYFWELGQISLVLLFEESPESLRPELSLRFVLRFFQYDRDVGGLKDKRGEIPVYIEKQTRGLKEAEFLSADEKAEYGVKDKEAKGPAEDREAKGKSGLDKIKEAAEAEDAREEMPFYVYTEAGSLKYNFIPSGFMPVTGSRDLRFNPNWKKNPYSGESCIRIEYKNNSGTRWAGIAWQNPANNWGTVSDAGYNLERAGKLVFWARGEKGDEVISEFKVGGILSGPYPDSDSVSIGPVELSEQWQKYEIDLKGKDLSFIVSGFAWSTSIDLNTPEGIVFYLDEIKYLE